VNQDRTDVLAALGKLREGLSAISDAVQLLAGEARTADRICG
jgi:hypothetical protein